MNLGQIESTLYDRLGFQSTPDSAVTRRIRNYVNKTHREILAMRGLGKLRRAVLTASSVASSPFMVMPQAAVAVIVIVNRTSGMPLDPISIQDLRFRDPTMVGTSSTPDSYVVINLAAAVAIDPTAAASLFAISDSALDASGTSVTVEGITSSGYYKRANVAMNGLTAVNLSTVITDWVHITKFFISAQAAGNVTLHQTSGVGTELARIPPAHSYPRYTQVQLSPTPSDAVTFYCDVELHVEDMVSVNDEPLIPEDFHGLLETGAMRREYSRKEKAQLWKIEDIEYQRQLSDLKGFVSRMGGIARRQNGQPRMSQLGPYFPPGT